MGTVAEVLIRRQRLKVALKLLLSRRSARWRQTPEALAHTVITHRVVAHGRRVDGVLPRNRGSKALGARFAQLCRFGDFGVIDYGAGA